jgi:hypothetical protein
VDLAKRSWDVAKRKTSDTKGVPGPFQTIVTRCATAAKRSATIVKRKTSDTKGVFGRSSNDREPIDATISLPPPLLRFTTKFRRNETRARVRNLRVFQGLKINFRSRFAATKFRRSETRTKIDFQTLENP